MPSSALRSEEHTSELQSLRHLVCRLLPGNSKSTRLKSSDVCISYAVFCFDGRRGGPYTRGFQDDSALARIPPSCWRCVPALFFFNDTAPTEIYTLSLHDALPIYWTGGCPVRRGIWPRCGGRFLSSN